MTTKRRKGFTLIELLVVIAIIGILAAMVFPVFARARESARKAVCLSNMKNIALAFQMYLADSNDTLPPSERRQEVADYLEAAPGGGNPLTCTNNPGWMDFKANPYLRWPVILDEYVKNRDVWMCPSAKVITYAAFILPGPDWLGYLKATEGSGGWGKSAGGMWGMGICMKSWPPGWGGDVTDSIVQGRIGGPNIAYTTLQESMTKPFAMGISTNYSAGQHLHTDLKLAAVADPVRYVICGESGVVDFAGEPTKLAYPELCCVECVAYSTPSDATKAKYPEYFVPGCAEYHASPDWARDPDRKKMATRHLGGVNVGYLDGHASWINSTALLNGYLEGEITGLETQCAGFTEADVEAYCGKDFASTKPWLP